MHYSGVELENLPAPSINVEKISSHHISIEPSFKSNLFTSSEKLDKTKESSSGNQNDYINTHAEHQLIRLTNTRKWLIGMIVMVLISDIVLIYPLFK